MKVVLYILLATALTGSVSYSLGAFLLRSLRLKLYRCEERFFAFIAGSACLSTLVFLLTACGLARKWVFYLAGFAIIALAVSRRLHRPLGEPLPPIPIFWNLVFWTMFVVYTWLYLGNALAPEVSADAVSYHLALVARYAREHHFPRITTDMYASLSAGAEMLFLYAFTIGKHSAAAMCEFLFLLALPFGILCYARRIGHPVAGVVAAGLVYASPIFGRVGTIAHNDVAGAAVVFALFYSIQLWRAEMHTGTLVLIGVLAGFAYAIKYTLGIAVIYAVLAVWLVCWKRKRPELRPALLAALSAFAVMAPWMIKNVIEVANPVSPFFNRIFPNPYVYVSFEDGYVDDLRHFNGVTLAEVPIEATVRGFRLQGLLGPVFLLAPLTLLVLRFPYARQLLIAAAIFLLPYFGNLGTRFLMPVVPFVALALGLTLEMLPPVAAVILLAHCIISWPRVIPRYAHEYAWRLDGSQWNVALRRTPEEQYLRDNIPDYDMGLILNRKVPANEPVLSPAMGNQAYHSRRIVVPYQSVFGKQLYDVMFRATMREMQPALRSSFAFPPRQVRRIRIVLTNNGARPWVVSEVRAFQGGRELQRDPSWRLRASVDPWEVQRAFDNSPITVWTSDRDAKPGMYLQIDFGRLQLVDAVAIDVPRNLDWATMRVEADGAVLSDKSVAQQIPWPQRMRRAATEELEGNGIHWIVFKDGELLADDLLLRYAQWGIKEEAYSNGYRLWHLE